MDWFVIDGAKPWDGRYDLDSEGSPLTIREWGWIKRYSGYLPMTMITGLNGRDPELFATLALISIRRAGRLKTDELDDLYTRFLDEPGLSITLHGDAVEESDADDPTTGANSKTTFSGDGSRSTSERSDGTAPPSGTREPASSVSVART